VGFKSALIKRAARWLTPVLIATAIVPQTGCIVLAYAIDDSHTPMHDVSGNRNYWGEYEVGSVYRLTTDVFIADVPNYSHGLALAPGKEFRKGGMWGGPTTVPEYEANPKQWPEMIGIVPKDTQLRLVQIKHVRYLVHRMEDNYPFAMILDGPWKGKMVEIAELSKCIDATRRLMAPDSRFLAKIEAPQNRME